jgi:hypothetical protein
MTSWLRRFLQELVEVGERHKHALLAVHGG